MKILPPTSEGIEAAVTALRDAQIVAYPTETVYGLAVDPFSDDALRHLFEVKERNADKPVLLILGESAHIERVSTGMSERATRYAEKFWPGPLTMLLPASDELPRALRGPDGRVALRLTASPVARRLCVAFGGALTSTSANAAGAEEARTLSELVLNGISAGIDGGELPHSLPSTLLDPESGAVLREGPITQQQLNSI